VETMNIRRLFTAILFAMATSTVASVAQDDPLPSWNDTATKSGIIAFVQKVTRSGTADFVPIEQRIAVFDMDGTLAPEKPYPAALVPVLEDIKAAVEKNPQLGQKPAVAALLKGDHAALSALGEAGITDLIAATTDGKTTEEIVRNVRASLASTRIEKLGVPYLRSAYRPMRELLSYLEANGFSVWICSGSPLLITREVATEMFGIPRERVMGSSARTVLEERGGKTVLVFKDAIEHYNDGDGKPMTINRAVGVRPIFVGGNEGGKGDIAMMRWSRDRLGPSFQILINHDDGEREFAYAEPDGYSLAAAAKYGFQVVSIKNDWKVIVAP